MWKKGLFFVVGLAVVLALASSSARAFEAPHSSSNSVDCLACHLSPLWCWRSGEINNFCASCHDNASAPYTSTHAPLVATHQSLKCTVCHNPHYQEQRAWQASLPTDFFMATGTITNANYNAGSDTTDLTCSAINYKTGWTAGKLAAKTTTGRQAILMPSQSRPYINFSVQAVNDQTKIITVRGDASIVLLGTFGIVYGQYIRHDIGTPNSGSREVKFLDRQGDASFVCGDNLYNGVCEVCHTGTDHFRNDGTGSDPSHSNMDLVSGQDCSACHKHTDGFANSHPLGTAEGCGTAIECHGNHDAHATHTKPLALGGLMEIECADCHDTANYPLLSDGQNLASTTACNACHSTDGAAIAKTYFISGDNGSWLAAQGEVGYCGSCHDATPGYNGANAAPNVIGNNSSYGFFINGHGKGSGSYSRLSWQDNSATGNPAANKSCTACHDLSSSHFSSGTTRLKSGYENNQGNSNCNQCHPPGASATGDPQFYTSSAAYESSAHSAKLCTDCHDVHGAAGAYPGMTMKNQETLCADCHSNGGHPGVGSDQFTISSKTYKLECISCHNVHVVTGTYAQAGQNKSPVTRITDITNIWGDVAGEKMNAYAGSGTYRTPNGESFTGAQLPDYATFCLTCHGQAGSAPFGISWSGDPHGKAAANSPNGYGTCPNWFVCGKAFGWDNDDCTGTQSECWPVIPRGAGDQLYSRPAYTHTERIAGANFTLSCTDCHTGHGSGTLGRSNVNGGSFSGNWNSMCNNCHYYYSDWHAGMSCGSASCHVDNSIHRATNMSGSGATRSFNPDLVLSYSFENNLNDSGNWQMDAKWYSAAGSFAAGKSGQAAVLNQGQTVQVGTENGYWSTDAGYHGTWVYTEMKYNTTLEAWVYPTDNAKNEYTIFNKHVGVGSNGGYSFSLKKVGNTLRATFIMAADNNGFTQDGRAGVRGAYSSVAIPLNTWTHVGATFDTAGPDRNAGDQQVGRIRIYVNGEDVTTSSIGGTTRQPGAGETSIYAYSENSPWNQGICYNGSWCASEFSIGGFDWETTNFVGMIDEAKVWNTTKNAAYFATYDAQAAPFISMVEGNVGSSQLTVTFSEGVYTNTGSSGALVAGDFTLTDTDNGRTITGVSHTAGSATAVLTLSSVLDSVNDINTDTLAVKTTTSIYDNYNSAAGTNAVTITTPASCPAGTVTFNLNEASGSGYVSDSSGILVGAVTGGASALTGSAYSGDGASRYIDFENSDICLQANTAMTLEARVKPTGIDASSNYVRRILARDGGGNYQLSLWRNNASSDQDPPNNVITTALWVMPENTHGGNAWKVILTDFSACPIVNDKWYQIKAVWNSSVVGGIPATIYVDDQGANGDNVGESWAGYMNCTDTDQSQMPLASRIWEGDVISPVDGDFLIGGSVSDHANNLFNGLIDWIKWQDSVD